MTVYTNTQKGRLVVCIRIYVTARLLPIASVVLVVMALVVTMERFIFISAYYMNYEADNMEVEVEVECPHCGKIFTEIVEIEPPEYP